MLLALLGQSATAQINEADRQARCQNNRDALSSLQAQERRIAYEAPGAVWSPEQVSRARTALQSIGQHIGNIARMNESILAPDFAFQDESFIKEVYRRQRAEGEQNEAIARDLGILFDHFDDAWPMRCRGLSLNISIEPLPRMDNRNAWRSRWPRIVRTS